MGEAQREANKEVESARVKRYRALPGASPLTICVNSMNSGDREGQSMGMNPDDFDLAFVSENYEDFCADEASIRKGFNAVLSCFHLTDNYYNYYKKHDPAKVSPFPKLKDFQIFLSSKTEFFKDIQCVANAYKHLYTRSDKSYVTVESGGAVTSIQIRGNDVVEIDGCAINDEGRSIIVYTRKNGTKVRLKEALDEVRRVWEAIL